MATKEIEQEVRFLAPLQPLKAPKSINGFRLVKTMPQKSETFYFDTADDYFLRNKAALRIRKFNSEWLITLKAQMADPTESSEISIPITKSDLDAILTGQARINDFFENPALLPATSLSCAGHLTTKRLALRYKNGDEEVEVAFDECWDDLPIGPFHVAEIENKTASDDSFRQIRKCFARLLPIIPTSLSKYIIIHKRQRGEPIREIFNLEDGTKETIRIIKALLRTRKGHTPLVVFVGGGSASGKTELFAKKIREAIRGARLLSMDDCFHGPAWMKEQGRKNWDDPEAMDIPLFRQWLLDLIEGKSVTKKIYKFGKEADGSETIFPPRVIIAEGIHALHETLNDIPGLRIFVDATTHCRFIRRMYRDALKRRTSQTPQEVFRMFFEHVEPSHQQWIKPTKARAHIVVENTYNPLREASAIGTPEIQLKIQGHIAESLLKEIGAEFVSEESHFDFYFTPSDKNIASRGEIVRARQTASTDGFTLTYKAVLPSGEVRFDIPVSRHDLSLFWKRYLPLAVIRKERRTFALGSVKINLDTVCNMGEWTELCASDIKEKENIRELMIRLGLDPATALQETYLSMMLKK